MTPRVSGVKENALLEIRAIEIGVYEKSRVHLSYRIKQGCLHMPGFSGGTRSKLLRAMSPETADWMEEGVTQLVRDRLCESRLRAARE